MLASSTINIALVGNPNSGKSSIFNSLTGLHQKIGNFPGVTVEKKIGQFYIDSLSINLLDLPGSYSIYPRREDEWITYKVLMDVDKTFHPDMIILVMDASNLKRNLLFCSQMIDLNIPMVIALTMNDIATTKGITINIADLSQELNIPIVKVNPRLNKGFDVLKTTIHQFVQSYQEKENKSRTHAFITSNQQNIEAIRKIQALITNLSDYKSIHYLTNHEHFELSPELQEKIESIEQLHAFNKTMYQADDTLKRYQHISKLISKYLVETTPKNRRLQTSRLDKWLLHPIIGYVILLSILFLLFQSVFFFAKFPMDGIVWSFKIIEGWGQALLPISWYRSLLIDGILAGLSGIIVFAPQIMILFGLITILEDTGYMARVSFLTDKLMRKVGLNGKSVMPMISAFACAVPAIMSTRNIENKKERLITILIAPFMSCSARLPIYTIMIALVVPNKYYLGWISLQGLIMMTMYLLGIIIALMISYILHKIIVSKEKSYFILELPLYRSPRWKTVVLTMFNKAKIFIKDAGKVIIVISLILWLLSNFSPHHAFEKIESQYSLLIQQHPHEEDELHREEASQKLLHSYAGILGKTIEPVIRPLGFDWKIGIALITSFAAREVFVGTMATLYSVDEDNNLSLQQKLKQATFANGKPVYTLPTAFSIMVFYVLAMQCMSTLAVVKKETNSWKIPIIQFVYMTGLAYIFSFLVFHVMSYIT